MTGSAPGLGAGLLRVGLVLGLAFVVIAVGAGWWQVVQAGPLSHDPANPLLLAAERGASRGHILDTNGVALAENAAGSRNRPIRRYRHPAAAPVVGYKSVVFGTAGLERTYDRQLIGLDQLGPGSELLRKFRPDPWDPSDVSTTIDVRLQELAARLLGDDRGAVVAIEPRSGRILALVSTPSFDPNQLVHTGAGRAYLDALKSDPGSPLLDRATQGRYVPGSVFKLVTAAAALESGAITPATTWPEQPEESRSGLRLDGSRIRDAERDVQLVEPLALGDAMEVSSNVWFARAGLAAGPEALARTARQLGIGTPVPFDLPSASGQVNGGDGSLYGFQDRVELANAAYGQGETLVTPLEMAMVTAAIANDGLLMGPMMVDQLVSENGEIVRFEPSVLRRSVSAETADAVTAAMVQAVQGRYADRYAGGAAVDGARTAGKSGTAQLAPGERPHSWFVGFAPANEPRIAIAVVVEHGGSGHGRAVPLGGRLMAAWLERWAPR